MLCRHRHRGENARQRWLRKTGQALTPAEDPDPEARLTGYEQDVCIFWRPPNNDQAVIRAPTAACAALRGCKRGEIMTLSIELTADEERRVQAAKANGVDVVSVVRAAIAALPRDSGTVGEQMVAAWARDGVIGSRADIADSQRRARMLRESAQTREPDNL